MLKIIKKLVCICLFMAVGITAADTASIAQTTSKKKYPALLIGLIPEQNIFDQLDRYEPLASYLSSKIGADIQLKVLVRYGNIIDNFVSSKMDGAFFGSFTFALAQAKLGLEAIARPASRDGISTYHGLILVRKDSRIRSALDARGKRFAFVDKATTAGYLLPLAYFKENNIHDYKTFFKETYFTGTHRDAIYDILNKKADIGAAKNTVYDRLAVDDPRLKNDLIVLKKSPDVPENGLAVVKGLDAAIKHKLKEALLDMHTSPEGKKILETFGAARFIRTTRDDYAGVYQYAKTIGLDLSTYDYLNE